MRAVRAGVTGLTLGGVAAALLANRALVGREARSARAGAGRLVPTREGDLHVLEEGDRATPPVVLLHGFAGSMHWFDRLAPLLADDHRPVRVDLLGHGGSAKPRAEYRVEQQAAAVAEALERLDVHSALFVGHSYGAAVSIAVAEHRRELVERVVILDEGPSPETATDPLMTRLGFVPVLGELMHRLSFDAAIRDGYSDAFAKGFDLSGEVGEQVVRDYRAMTFTSYKRCWRGEQRYLGAEDLDERLRRLGLPALAIFGDEDRFFRARASAEAYRRVPGLRAEVLAGVGHSPNVERPEEVARLVRELAAVAAA
jgi:pimeloyl-ACP methyl ester carboxylesterase